ncbi:MAG TPA: class I SAM-dependent methyltransferase [Terriglobales bacterium]|nr:class I SAM-dependent methyltransferase [Terriglobales bacterium]
MTQNIYDNAHFFAGYSRLQRSIAGLDGMPEWPALRAMLPRLREASIIDLGCGFGWFCRWVKEQGAAQVRGIDVSANMLERARQLTPDMSIRYERADLNHLALAAGSVDLAYSALALHYLEHLDTLVYQVHQALRPGGHFVFSVEHPIYTAPSRPGWSVYVDGHKTWPVDNYLVEGPRVTDWLAEGVVKQHRTVGTYLNLLIHHGFTITQVDEWRPSAAQIAAEPELAEELLRPMFLLVSARRGH